MHVLPKIMVALSCASLSSGCVRQYEPPRPDQPHAIVKVRRTYDRPSGPLLREVINIGEYRAFERSGVPLEAPGTDAILVHPGPASWTFAASFFHNESRMVSETYYEQQPYTETESYSCGTGTSYQSCTRTVTHYRSVAKTRWVTKTVEVTDGHCEVPVAHQAETDHLYIVQFHYLDNDVCQAECYEQVRSPSGVDENRRCQPAQAAKTDK
jgi:hypothetical protein